MLQQEILEAKNQLDKLEAGLQGTQTLEQFMEMLQHLGSGKLTPGASRHLGHEGLSKEIRAKDALAAAVHMIADEFDPDVRVSEPVEAIAKAVREARKTYPPLAAVDFFLFLK